MVYGRSEGIKNVNKDIKRTVKYISVVMIGKGRYQKTFPIITTMGSVTALCLPYPLPSKLLLRLHLKVQSSWALRLNVG